MNISITEKCGRCNYRYEGRERIATYLSYDSYEYVDGVCPSCYGTQILPTELGREVLDLIEWASLRDKHNSEKESV